MCDCIVILEVIMIKVKYIY